MWQCSTIGVYLPHQRGNLDEPNILIQQYMVVLHNGGQLAGQWIKPPQPAGEGTTHKSYT